MEISGRSLPEDVSSFYEPVLNWLNEYADNPNKKTIFNFKLTYFNTNSSRLILDILDLVKKYENAGGTVTVNWYYDKKDPDMVEEVEDFTLESGMKINLISH